jgi:hypothetical protein
MGLVKSTYRPNLELCKEKDINDNKTLSTYKTKALAIKI